MIEDEDRVAARQAYRRSLLAALRDDDPVEAQREAAYGPAEADPDAVARP
jgi:hypothetical protein